MITNNKITDIIKALSEMGHSIRVRDISYILLCRSFEDETTAYKSLFGESAEIEKDYYNKSAAIIALKKYMTDEFAWDSKDDITFEENKAYMLKLKAKTEKAMEAGEIDKKDALKILADISTKLNDKFGAKEEIKDQIVQISPKYDYICPRCQTEVARRPMTKEEAMKEFNLIENKK